MEAQGGKESLFDDVLQAWPPASSTGLRINAGHGDFIRAAARATAWSAPAATPAIKTAREKSKSF